MLYAECLLYFVWHAAEILFFLSAGEGAEKIFLCEILRPDTVNQQ